MKRWRIVAGIIVFATIAVFVPLIMLHDRHERLVAAIDQMQPESISKIKQLLAEGEDVKTRGHDNTVAMVAAFWNDAELLKQALDAGVDPNATDAFGNTALHFATIAPNIELTKLLLAAGANVNQQNGRGETPLIGAVRNTQFELIKLLLAEGAKVDVASKSGETALSIAQSLKPGGPRPMRPDLTSDDFVGRLNEATKSGER